MKLEFHLHKNLISSQMPSKKCQSDSEFEVNNCSDVQQQQQQYNTICYQTRLKLIELVIQQKYSVIKASKQLGIKLSTAKFIINSYKKKGKIMKRKRQIKKENLVLSPSQIQVQRQIRSQFKDLKPEQKDSKPETIDVKIQVDQVQPTYEKPQINFQAPICIPQQYFYLLNYPAMFAWQNYVTQIQY